MNHPVSRLVARYGQSHGMYLFGEYCLLQALGYEAFRTRHTESQISLLASQLAPLSLWLWENQDDPTTPVSEASHRLGAEQMLESTASTLLSPPLRLGLGIDLFRACLAWAGAQSENGVDPGAWFEPSRAALGQILGFSLPALTVTLESEPPAHAYRLYVWGELVLEGEAFPGQDQLIGPVDGPPPILPYAWGPDPAGAGWVTWMAVGPGSLPPDDLPRLHWLSAIDRHLTAALPAFASRVLTVPMVHALLAAAEPAGYDHELERYVSLPELKLVFKKLLGQGLPLRPLEPMLESMLKAILQELASRPLSPPELERINRQLPVFTTAKLVGVVRRAMGLPETPPPPFVWPGPPGPLPLDSPALEALDRTPWQALFEWADQTLPAARACAAVLRTGCRPPQFRSGLYLSLALAFAPLDAPFPHARAGHDRIVKLLLLPRMRAALAQYAALGRDLAAIRSWLDTPGVALGPTARAGLAEPQFAAWRWILGRPGALLRAAGLADSVQETVTGDSEVTSG